MLDKSVLTGKASLALRGDDLYETHTVAIEALMRVEHLPPRIWEPACGPGNIVRVLRAAGHKVLATDLVNYECPDSEHGVDFLMERAHEGYDCIVTNPPFKLATEFVEHALELAPRVIMLMRLAFLESERRTAVLDGGQLVTVHVFKQRLPMMHREGWEGPKLVSSIVPFAWFVWSRYHRGPATLNRISCRAPAGGAPLRTIPLVAS
jgi:hypothetical protein